MIDKERGRIKAMIKINLEDKTKEQILEEFVDICHRGTSRDCMIFAHEAKRQGVGYEELCEYKRIEERR